jgi:CarD family transcriptional regulator
MAACQVSRSALLPHHRLAVGDPAIYPPHGLGRIVAIADQEIAGETVEIMVIRFEAAGMTIRVPTQNSGSVGLRRVASHAQMQAALRALIPSGVESEAPSSAADWKRRFKQYADRVNTGDPVQLAEVVRELAAATSLTATTRSLYNTAVARLAQELAIVETIGEAEAAEQIAQIVLGTRTPDA